VSFTHRYSSNRVFSVFCRSQSQTVSKFASVPFRNMDNNQPLSNQPVQVATIPLFLINKINIRTTLKGRVIGWKCGDTKYRVLLSSECSFPSFKILKTHLPPQLVNRPTKQWCLVSLILVVLRTKFYINYVFNFMGSLQREPVY